MMSLLEKMLRVNEDAAGLKALYKIYKGQEMRLDPDPADLFTALSMMEEYVKRSLKVFPPGGGGYIRKRFQEIRQALKSRDTRKQMIALDNAVDYFHSDFLFYAEGVEEEVDLELEALKVDVSAVLGRLGRM